MVNTFTVSQSGIVESIIVYPDADGTTNELTSYPAGANNYVNIDENKNLADDDTTYNYSSSTDLKYDLYSLPNQSLSGSINYVNVIARSKSHLNNQDKDGSFKIIITDDAGVTISKSDDKQLKTSYGNYSYSWFTNPRTSLDWTWTDINNLEIGAEFNSPITSIGSVNQTLKPNAAGDVTDISHAVPYGSTHWTVVNDDNEDTKVRNKSVAREYDLYNIDAPDITDAGVINNVVVFIKVRRPAPYSLADYSNIVIKTGGVEYRSTNFYIPDSYSWNIYSYTWTINPDTGVAWTWANITGLQIGVELPKGTTYSTSECCEVYCVVSYALQGSPDIRLTQNYALINYNLPDINVSVPIPEEISSSYTRNVNMINFWNGNREVYSLDRNNKTLILRGTDYQDTACTTVQTLRDMGKRGDTITLSGLNMYIFNDNYKLLSYGWKENTQNPPNYEWILELEYLD